MTLEEVKILIEAETKQFRDELKKVKSEMGNASKDITKSTVGIKGALNSIKSVVGGLSKSIIALTGIGGFAMLGKQAISMASDMQEVQNVVDVSFGSMSSKMEEFAKSSIENFGMSSLSAKRYGSTFMAMAKGMGMASDVASDMSLELTSLIGDTASFYNTTQDIAQTKLASIFTGETEALKQWGIVMTQANLQAFALKLGIDKQISSMSQAELVMLRYKYVTEQLSLAQGDFARTSGSWANQVRILQENFKQLLSIIGNGLIKVLTPVIQVINFVIGKITQLAQVIADVFGKLFGKNKNTNTLAQQMGDASVGSSQVSDDMNNTAKATEKATKKAKEWKNVVMGFDVANIAPSQSESDSSGSSSSGVGGSFGANDFGMDFSSFGESEDNLTSSLDRLSDRIASFLQDVFTPFISKAKEMWQEICVIFDGLWNQYGESILSNIEEFKTTTLDLFKTMYEELIEPLIKPFMDMLQGIWDNTLKQLIADIGEFVLDTFNAILDLWNDALAPFISYVVETLGPLWTETWESIFNIFENICEAIGEAIGGVLDALSGIIDFVVGVFTGDWDRAWKGIEDLFKGFERVVKGLGDGLTKSLVEFFKWAWKAIKEVFAITGIKSFFEKVYKGIKEVISKVPQYFKDKFTTAWNNVKNVFSKGSTIFKGIQENIGALFKKVVNNLIGGINTVIQTPIKKLNGILKDIRDTKVLNMKPFAWLPTLPVPKIPKLASGGILDNVGQLFVAREKGPELVGTMGSHSAVANNVQIIAGIKQGVIEGMIQVMSRYSNQGQDIHVHVQAPDGSIKTTIKKYNEYMKQTNGKGGFIV